MPHSFRTEISAGETQDRMMFGERNCAHPSFSLKYQFLHTFLSPISDFPISSDFLDFLVPDFLSPISSTLVSVLPLLSNATDFNRVGNPILH